jgi:outer membrane lipoprotein LolB
LQFLLRLRSARPAFFCAGLLAIFLIAGCAQSPRATDQNGLIDEYWSGRISLQVHSEPAQSFSASFELKGQPGQGELKLISPLGSVLSVLRWSPGEAVLDSGNGQVQRFSSVDELMAQATGTAVPVAALFAWLLGDPVSVSGWSADLSRHAEGRISAKRIQPAPLADLRVILDR